ncbi:nitric oxide reductase activation protein NorD [Marinicella rhabdoformis]|uniref:nitric oxide reductase activation protein NorD n=1 Tax=Marinicella rhabdoformis TaxID=2580566 RepID=UPI0012AED93D|nr:VWA domain-containing protein [Marinicella rhabdoformis]
MEEWVGVKWHHYITQKAMPSFTEAAVALDSIQKSLAIYFRALGGDKALKISFTGPQKIHSHRNWIQKIAGAGDRLECAHFQRDHLYLPEVINCFADSENNRALYYWLAAMASHNQSPHSDHLLAHNLYLTQSCFKQWPGLRKSYNTLIKKHIKHRRDINKLPKSLQAAEQQLRDSLLDLSPEPGIPTDLLSQLNPVPLWLYPSPLGASKTANNNDQQDPDMSAQASHNEAKKNKRYQAERIEDAEKDGLLSFRLESLFTWSEFINLDRSEEDGEDEDAMRVADDLDQLSVSRGETASKLKLDLDLPSPEYDDHIKLSGILLPEWHHKKQQLIKDHCSLQVMQIKHTPPATWSPKLRKTAQQLKRQFEALKPQRQWFNNQSEGQEPDLTSFLDFMVSKHQGSGQSDPKLYRHCQQSHRDLSSLILTDISLSTDAYISQSQKVIDVIKDSLYLTSECLHAANERFAIAGFTSRKRNLVRYYDIKGFDQPYNDDIRNAIHAIEPNYYTRMGTAIRYGCEQLNKQKTSQKLMIILTDGKPNDLDHYEGKHGLEDTRHAIIEAKQAGITPFCVSIDQQAYEYLPYLFGSQSYFHIKKATDLPKKLPQLYYQLTT